MSRHYKRLVTEEIDEICYTGFNEKDVVDFVNAHNLNSDPEAVSLRYVKFIVRKNNAQFVKCEKIKMGDHIVVFPSTGTYKVMSNDDWLQFLVTSGFKEDYNDTEKETPRNF